MVVRFGIMTGMVVVVGTVVSFIMIFVGVPICCMGIFMGMLMRVFMHVGM